MEYFKFDEIYKFHNPDGRVTYLVTFATTSPLWSKGQKELSTKDSNWP